MVGIASDASPRVPGCPNAFLPSTFSGFYLYPQTWCLNGDLYRILTHVLCVLLGARYPSAQNDVAVNGQVVCHRISIMRRHCPFAVHCCDAKPSLA